MVKIILILLITTVSISSSRKALLRQKRQFDNNFSGGVGSFQNCNRPGQCHSSGAIPNNQNVAQSGNNGGQGMFDNNFSGGVGSFQNCNRPGQCHASGAIPGNKPHKGVNGGLPALSRPMPMTGVKPSSNNQCADKGTADWCAHWATPERCERGPKVIENCQKSCRKCNGGNSLPNNFNLT